MKNCGSMISFVKLNGFLKNISITKNINAARDPQNLLNLMGMILLNHNSVDHLNHLKLSKSFNFLLT